MTQLFFVRHGPTHAKTMIGWTDLPADLSDRDQLARLDAFLPRTAHILSSDLTRTIQTADALQSRRTRLPHDPSLRELHFGDWENRTFDEVETEDPDRISEFWRNPGAVRAPGGESWRDMRARTDKAVDALTRSHNGAPLIVVAHFGVILGQVERALGLSTTDAFAQRIEPLSVTELHIENGAWRVERVNHAP